MLLLVVGAGLGIYFATVHRTHNSRPLGGANTDVSPIIGAQTEVSIAVDPANPHVLLVGTNDDKQPQFRAYTSTDGGARWQSSLGPPLAGDSACVRGDPAVAIDRAGHEYAAYTTAVYNTNPTTPVFCSDDLTKRLQVAERNGPRDRWRAVTIPPSSYKYGFDDKPSLAVTASGRVYLAWSRLLSNTYETTVVSHSDDHGKTWSRPVVLHPSLVNPQLVALATAGNSLYAAGVDARLGVWITRSGDGTHFRPVKKAATLRANIASGCSIASGHPLAEQAGQCAGPNPTIAVLRGRVVVLYGDVTAHAAQAVYAVGLDRRLDRVLFRTPRIGLPATSKANQFWPAGAADASRRLIWLCYYDTTGSFNRRRAWFTCTTSRNGRTWTKPIRAASKPSLVESILGDAYSYGGYAGLAAAHGVAHPAWSDTRETGDDEDVFTAAIPARRGLR